jgi:hypothetical protein
VISTDLVNPASALEIILWLCQDTDLHIKIHLSAPIHDSDAIDEQ